MTQPPPLGTHLHRARPADPGVRPRPLPIGAPGVLRGPGAVGLRPGGQRVVSPAAMAGSSVLSQSAASSVAQQT